MIPTYVYDLIRVLASERSVTYHLERLSDYTYCDYFMFKDGLVVGVDRLDCDALSKEDFNLLVEDILHLHETLKEVQQHG